MNFDEVNSRGVHYKKAFSRRGSKNEFRQNYKLPIVKFSCLFIKDSNNRLNIKGWFQNFISIMDRNLWLIIHRHVIKLMNAGKNFKTKKGHSLDANTKRTVQCRCSRNEENRT